MKNNGISSTSPTDLIGAEHRGGRAKRDVAEHSANQNRRARRGPVPSRPDPAVVADAGFKPGDIGALQRREGLYSSHLSTFLDEGQYLCSTRTMYRILEREGESGEPHYDLVAAETWEPVHGMRAEKSGTGGNKNALRFEIADHRVLRDECACWDAEL